MRAAVVEKIKRFDQGRPNVPGEHWLALGTAISVWLGTRRHPSLAVRVLGSLAGTALVARAATGRDVPRRLVRWLPFQNGAR